MKQGIRLRAFTLVEAAISMALVSVLLVAALNTLGASKLGQLKTMVRGRGHLLAQELLSEIMRQSYADPEEVGPIDLTKLSLSAVPLGIDFGELATTRADFDDVDDYDGWSGTPPQDKNGVPITNAEDWERSVTVSRVNPVRGWPDAAAELGLKRIIVTVTYNGAQAAQLVGIKGAGLPVAPTGPKVLFVVTKENNATTQESVRQMLMESWGFTVTMISASDPQIDFDQAVATTDVAYISGESTVAVLGTMLREAAIGVINENSELTDDLGFSTTTTSGTATDIRITDGTHHITSGFETSMLTIFSTPQTVHALAGVGPIDLQILARTKTNPVMYYPSLAALEAGALLYGGGTAQGRRIYVPWAGASCDINALNEDGLTIMKRTIEWAANMDDGSVVSPPFIPLDPIE